MIYTAQEKVLSLFKFLLEFAVHLNVNKYLGVPYLPSGHGNVYIYTYMQGDIE